MSEYKEKLSGIGNPYLVEIVVPVKDLDMINDYKCFFGKLCRFYKKYSSDFREHYVPDIRRTYKMDILPSEINNIFNVRINDEINNFNEKNYISIY